MMDPKAHWDAVYRRRPAEHQSWFESEARLSAELIERAAPERDAPILDVGGGASTLVNRLLASGYTEITVLDLSGTALGDARMRLGSAAATVRWIEADILTADLPAAAYAVWHDRAAFHFPDRRAVPPALRRATAARARARWPGGSRGVRGGGS